MTVIRDELDDVAQRLVSRAFGVLGKQEALPIPALRQVIERNFPEEWQTNQSIALQLTLERAIARLDGMFGGITTQEAALRLLNLDGTPRFPGIKKLDEDSIVGAKGDSKKMYGHLRAELVEKACLAGAGDTTIRRKISDLRRDLAQILVDPAFPFTSVEAGSDTLTSRVFVVRSALADEFIGRPAYEQAIRQLRDAGEKHIWLWGDAGTGKTRLARAANRDRIAERAVPVLTARDERTLQDQMTNLIVQSGVDAAVVNPANRLVLFLDQLNKGRLPQTLVFDDIPRGDLVTTLTSTRGSFIIFTSIECPPPEYAGPSIEVRDMATSESEQMIRSRLLGIQDADLHMLNVALTGRPLAVEHSCSYLRETGMSIVDYCTALARQPAHTLDAAGDAHGRTLTRVYDMILERLTDSFNSIRALDYVLFTQPGLVTEDMVSYLWVDSLDIPSPEAAASMMRSMDSLFVSTLDVHRWPGVTVPKVAQIPYVDPVAMVGLRAALRRLVDFGLIRSEDGRIVMHQLTRSILRALRQDHAADVFERVKKTARALLAIDEWTPGEPLQGHLLLWAPHVARAVAQIDATAALDLLATLSRDDVERLALLGAMVVRAHLQIGVSVTAMPSVQHLFNVVAVRALWTGYDAEERNTLTAGFFGLYQEMMTVLTLSAGFSRELDGALFLNDVAPQQTRIANGIRLDYDTEWEPSHNFVNVEAEQHFPKERVATAVEVSIQGSR